VSRRDRRAPRGDAGVIDPDAGRRMPAVDLEQLDVVHDSDGVVFDGEDGRISSDVFVYLDAVR
jgi:hypothetical protein